MLLCQPSQRGKLEGAQGFAGLIFFGREADAAPNLPECQGPHRTVAGRMQEQGVLQGELAAARVGAVVAHLEVERAHFLAAQAADAAVSLVDLHLEELGRRGPPLLVPEEAHHSPLRVMPSAPPISTRTNPTKSTAKNVIEAPAAAA